MKTSKGILYLSSGIVAMYSLALLTLYKNQEEGIYGIDADSIGIPLLFNGVAGLIVFVLGLIALVLASKYTINTILGCLLCILAALVSLIGAAYWYGPNHSMLGLSYVYLFVLCLMFVHRIIKRRHLANASN